ncbi:MAG: A24 family peptidase, partial [Geminicoccaceae bacterium]
ATGVVTDIESRRLPNWLTAGVAALYPIYVCTAPFPVDWSSALLIAGVVFSAGFGLFAFDLMGGGDVKLMAALALWAGIEHIALFLIITSLAGGLLAIVMLMLRRWATSPLRLALSLFLGPITNKLLGPTTVVGGLPPADMAENHANNSLPYGVAIAAGGFAVIYALLQL